MLSLILLSVAAWLYLAFLNTTKRRCHVGYANRGGGGGDDPPAVPRYEDSFPSWASGLPQEQLGLIRQYLGSSLPMPAEYDMAGDVFKGLLAYQPEQFKYPLEDIQKALDAQQSLQLQQYQNQIRPVLASQGQLDSTYYANLLGDYLKGQQAQSLQNTAQLLTNQAGQNFQLSQWLPTFRSGLAGALQGLGGARTGINQYNLSIPMAGQEALGGVYGQGLQFGDRQYSSAMQQYQQALDAYNQDQEQKQSLWRTIGMVSPIGGAIYGGVSGGGQGVASSLAGTFDTAKLAAGLYGSSMGIPTMGVSSWGTSSPGFGGGQVDWGTQPSIYNPKWSLNQGSMAFKNYYPY